MSRFKRLPLPAFVMATAFLWCHPNLFALEEASGVNLSLEEGFGARQQALALRFAGYGKTADVIAHSPANMNDVNDLTFSTSHSERFAQAQFDHFAMLLPVDHASTVGVGLARYGVSGIEWRPEGSEASVLPPGLFTTADYWVTTAFSRRLGSFDIGGTLQVLYRDLDQSGFGLRGDAMVNYTANEHLRLQALLVGLLPSSARWSSGYSEYESPDLQLGFSYTLPSPYLYGRWQFAWETEGLFQVNGKSGGELTAKRGALNPKEAWATSNLGVEFAFDFGMSLRAGLEELGFPSELGGLWHAGMGYTWRGILGVDYAFTPHPDLPSSHRIAIQWTPNFPKFSGKNYRPKSTLQAKSYQNDQTDVKSASPLPQNQMVPNVSPSMSKPTEPSPSETQDPSLAPKTTELPQSDSAPIQPEREILED